MQTTVMKLGSCDLVSCGAKGFCVSYDCSLKTCKLGEGEFSFLFFNLVQTYSYHSRADGCFSLSFSLYLFDFPGCTGFRKLQQDSYYDEVSDCSGMHSIFYCGFSIHELVVNMKNCLGSVVSGLSVKYKVLPVDPCLNGNVTEKSRSQRGRLLYYSDFSLNKIKQIY